MKSNVKSIAIALGCAVMFAGCCSYTGQIMSGDDMMDTENQEFFKQASAKFEKRKDFKRDVKIVEDEESMSDFLSPNWVPRSSDARVNALCQNIDARRAIAKGARAKLREIVSGMHDFKLVEENSNEFTSIQVGDQPESNVYVMKYSILNIDLQYRNSKGLDPLGINPVAGKLTGSSEWVANATVQIRFLKPDNQTVIATFLAKGTNTQSDDGSAEPNVTMLEGAAMEAVEQTMEQYAEKFAPPVFVTKTSDDGHYACLNLGTSYGLRAGMPVEFLRHYAKQGADGQTNDTAKCVARGVIGAKGAPIDSDYAWVHIEHSSRKWDPAAPRFVFQGTSVKLVKQTAVPKKKLQGFGLKLPDIGSVIPSIGM